ncbi:MAG: deoxyribonuclease IV [Bacilli bacterium]|jgi:deoxyribonuclease-4|nr:deoxyribonuclease IV [Bacilli bacterium]
MEGLYLGSHVSFKREEQMLGSVVEALSYGANTFMFYTGAPQNTARASIDLELTSLAHKLMEENNIDIKKVVVHAPYIINLANDNDKYEFAIRFLKEEISRVEMLGVELLVLHPGSHVGLGSEKGIENIIRALNIVIDSKTSVKICLETMAGKGSECGKTFEEISLILKGMKYPDKVGVCLDTCHIHDAGYSLHDLEDTLTQFDNMIGLSKLWVLHINDSKNEKGSHKDRHENFGFGTIGFENLMHVIEHPKLKGIPKILETPYVSVALDLKEKIYPPYKFEIEMIKNRKLNHNLIEDIRNYYKKD